MKKILGKGQNIVAHTHTTPPTIDSLPTLGGITHFLDPVLAKPES
jgi:hypothetical protein